MVMPNLKLYRSPETPRKIGYDATPKDVAYGKNNPRSKASHLPVKCLRDRHKPHGKKTCHKGCLQEKDDPYIFDRKPDP